MRKPLPVLTAASLLLLVTVAGPGCGSAADDAPAAAETPGAEETPAAGATAAGDPSPHVGTSLEPGEEVSQGPEETDPTADDGLVSAADLPADDAPDDGRTASAVTRPKPQHGALTDELDPGTVAEETHVESTKHYLRYNQGHVMDTQRVYMIYYGDWSRHRGSQANIATFLHGLDHNDLSSRWEASTKELGDRYGGRAWRHFAVGKHVTVPAWYGRHLNETSTFDPIYHTVLRAIRRGLLPRDKNGIYLVLPAPGISLHNGLGTMCEDFCGYHTWNWRTDLHYGAIMNDAYCTNQGDGIFWGDSYCRAVPDQSSLPNHDNIADPAVNVIAHEIAEAATDPAPWNGWVDVNHQENADKCEWRYGHLNTTADGRAWNLHDRTYHKNWLVQKIWENVSGTCTMGAPR